MRKEKWSKYELGKLNDVEYEEKLIKFSTFFGEGGNERKEVGKEEINEVNKYSKV